MFWNSENKSRMNIVASISIRSKIHTAFEEWRDETYTLPAPWCRVFEELFLWSRKSLLLVRLYSGTFRVYSGTLSILQIIRFRTIGLYWISSKKNCKEIVVVYFKVQIRNFSRGIQENNKKKPVRIFCIACKIRTVYLPNTKNKSYIWKQRLNQVAPTRNPSLQKPATELCQTPVDFSSVHNLTIILWSSHLHSNLSTGLLHKSLPNTSLHIPRELQRSSIPQRFIWPS
jgi:hypothetical protein